MQQEDPLFIVANFLKIFKKLCELGNIDKIYTLPSVIKCLYKTRKNSMWKQKEQSVSVCNDYNSNIIIIM